MRRYLLIALVLALGLAVLASLPPPRRELEPPRGLSVPPRGAIHVHSRRSDGTGTVDQVAAAAARAGLAFVIFTDHGDATRAPEPPAYRSGVLCIDGVEISTEDGHLVALGLPEAPYPLGGEARDVIEDVVRLGGISIAAHPTSARSELRWREWTAPFDGIEWLNGDSEWRDETGRRLARVILAYPFRRAESLGLLLDRSPSAFARWDALTARRRVVAVAAVDAHARIGLPDSDPYDSRRGGPAIPIPGYESLFRTFSIALPQLVLTDDAAADAAAVLQEIRSGHVYSTIDALAGPAALRFTAASAAEVVSGGDAMAVADGLTLRAEVNAPPEARIALLRNGSLVRESAGPLEYEADAAPAVYRVEVRLPDAPGEPAVPWIVSNPIYVGRPAGEAPPVRPPGERRTVVYADGPAADWSVESNATSQGAVDAVAAVGGTQLLFRYALSGARSDHPYAALVRPVGEALREHDRLTFTAQADSPLRLSVQLRAPTDGNGERWARSVYVDRTPREITVYFDDMRPRGQTTEVRPDLSRVGSLLFVVDTLNTPIGASGQLFLDHIRYER